MFYTVDDELQENVSGNAGLAGLLVESPLPVRHVHNVTVPGAAAGWVDTVSTMGSGKLSLEEILEPAIQLAEEGFPVAPVTSQLGERALAEHGSCSGFGLVLQRQSGESIVSVSQSRGGRNDTG
ncbi:hypothetical protein GBAR_LOCUS24216 [Geodia barretti]|uniref:Uncharacterized protein n=1 Tax=Geodia barretti TaxID=519541 RepID=A0AA35X4A2_GEOBA|nr:hypothetical protein GBAR_LOCUS24216 [Geodia barretti]